MNCPRLKVPTNPHLRTLEVFEGSNVVKIKSLVRTLSGKEHAFKEKSPSWGDMRIEPE
jgi:hypothetical protein